MNTEQQLRRRVLRGTAGTLFMTLITALLIGLLSSPAVYLNIRSGPRLGGLAVLAVTGLGLVGAHNSIWGEKPTDISKSLGTVGRSLYTLMVIVMYNVITLAAVFIALVAGELWSVAIAAPVAFAYPIFDFGIVQRGVPLSISGVTAVGIAVGIKFGQITEHIRWRDVHPDEFVGRLLGAGRGDPR